MFVQVSLISVPVGCVAGLHPVTEDQLERVIEELEIRCWEKVQTIVKTEEGLGIEYDENVICDVCRSVSIFAMLLMVKLNL
jgi:hypothetical protein